MFNKIKLSNGFSLLELMIIMLISAILLISVIPSQKIFFDRASSQVLSSQLLRAISMARSEAILRGRMVSLCKSNDQTNCLGSWEEGQIIFADENQNGHVINAAHVLSVFSGRASGKLLWKSSLHRDYLQFLPSGLTNSQNGTFWFCEKNMKNPSWLIKINHLGRARFINNDNEDAHNKNEFEC